MKFVVYTVISGNYDKIKPIPNLQDGIDFFVISDTFIEVPFGWELIVKNKEKSPIVFNRYYKMNPFTLFFNYDHSIYIDAHLEVTSSLLPLFNECISSNKGIAMYDHPVRDCAYEEAKIIKRLGYAYYRKVNDQMNRYLNEGYKSLYLKQANIIYRSHHDEGVKHAMKLWWHEFQNGAKRDQLSFSYSCLSCGCDVYSLGKHDAWYGHRYFKHHGHVKRNKSKNLKWKLINKIASMLKIDPSP